MNTRSHSVLDQCLVHLAKLLAVSSVAGRILAPGRLALARRSSLENRTPTAVHGSESGPSDSALDACRGVS